MSLGAPDRPWAALPREMAAVLRPELPTLADEIIEAIREGVPAYARPLEGPFGLGLRVGVEQALGQFVDEVEGAERSFDRRTYVQLGRGEVRAGRTLDVLLAAYRMGARVAWRRLAAAGREAGIDAEILSLLAESIFAYIDELSALSAEGYASAQSDAAGAQELRRRQLVRLLVQDPPADPVSIEAAALDAGWRLPGELAALALPDPGGGRPPRLPAYVLLGAIPEGLCGIVPDPRAPGRRAELARALGDRLAALGPAVPWVDAPTSFARATAALRLAGDGALPAGGLLDADDHGAALLLTADRRMARDLSAARLAALDDLTPAARDRLLTTLTAWLAAQGRVQDAATALHVHPQTVRYRLARLRELLGDALDDPDARFELELALRARWLLYADSAGTGAGAGASASASTSTASVATRSYHS